MSEDDHATLARCALLGLTGALQLLVPSPVLVHLFNDCAATEAGGQVLIVHARHSKRLADLVDAADVDAGEYTEDLERLTTIEHLVTFS